MMDILLVLSVVVSGIITALYIRSIMIDYSVYYLEKAAARTLMMFGKEPEMIHEYLWYSYKYWLTKHDITEHLVSYKTWLEIVIEDTRIDP